MNALETACKVTASLGYDQNDVNHAYSILQKEQSALYGLRHKIESCKACSLSKHCQNPVAGAGFSHKGVMIIGEAPSKEDIEARAPFMGVAGVILTIILNKLKVSRQSIYLTNMVKCKKDHGEKVTFEEAEKCLHHLYNEIAIIEPSVIITMGDAPFLVLSNNEKGSLQQFRGEWFNETHTTLNIPVMPTHHPITLAMLEGKPLTEAKKQIWADLQLAFKKANLLS